MEIQPNSNIILYSGMPLDNDYTDTLYFASAASQTSFFLTAPAKKRLTRNSYQRVNSGVFQASCVADDIYDVNYMAFQNTAYGNKWFYAFVDSVEYLNNGNTEVRYTIDVMQTYMFDVELEQCLVEREHTATDNLFGNILPEPQIVPTVDYQFEGYQVLERTSADIDPITGDAISIYDPDIVIMYVDVDGSTVDGGLYNSTYSGAKAVAFRGDSAGVSGANALIAHYIQQPEAIINIYMCPHFISLADPNDAGSGGTSLTPSNRFALGDVHILPTQLSANIYQSINGYAPKNKKLFCYPYCYLHMDDGGNDARLFHFEYFSTPQTSLDFWLYGSAFYPIQLSLCPINYKGYVPNTQHSLYGNTLERLTLADYPMCSWNYDTYRAWAAQNAFPIALDIVSGVVGSVASGDVGGLTNTVTGAIKQYHAAKIAPDTIRGTINNGNALYSSHSLKFHVARAHLQNAYLEIVDDFFTMYGYSVNRVKVPNRNVRPHFTYTKTSGCKVKGNCPADALVKIRSIYDNGITFWRNASEVGNYSVDNRPV